MLQEVPQLAGLVKLAQDWDEFPCDTKATAFFSNVYSSYLEKTSAFTAPEHVKRAAKLYKIAQEDVDSIVKTLVQKNLPKEISRADEQMKQAELVLLEKSAADVQKFAAEFQHQFQDLELQVKAAQIPLYKQACLEAVVARSSYKPHAALAALHAELTKQAEDILPKEVAEKTVQALEAIDKSAGYAMRGFNFVKDAAKRSTLYVTCNGNKIPVETFIKLGKDRLSQIIGAPITSLEPQELKAVIESLPRDSIQLLMRHIK